MKIFYYFIQNIIFSYSDIHVPLYLYYSTHLSFCFNFFLHGESSVCASIEVKQHPPVWRLTNNHLSTAQENPGNLQGTVIYTMYKCSPLTKKLRIILLF